MIAEQYICDVCGKEKSKQLKGMEIIIKVNDNTEDISPKLLAEIKEVKKRFGTTKFDICMICWLKSMGIKEI